MENNFEKSYSERIDKALNEFLKQDLFLKENSEYLLEEKENDGRTMLHLTVNGRTLCISDFDSKGKCNFVNTDKGMNKSVDHLLFRLNSDEWEIHLIEMKTTVNSRLVRENLQGKFKASYLQAKAIAIYLGIDVKDENIYCCVTFETDRVKPWVNANMINRRAKVGESKTETNDIKHSQNWIDGICEIDFGERKKFKLIKIKMERNENNILIGDLNICE